MTATNDKGGIQGGRRSGSATRESGYHYVMHLITVHVV